MFRITASGLTRGGGGGGRLVRSGNLAARATPVRMVGSSQRVSKGGQKLKPGEVDEHARIFDPDARAGTAAAATSSQGDDFTEHRPVDTSASRSSQTDSTPTPRSRESTSTSTGTPPAPDVKAGSGVDPGYSSSSSSSSQSPSSSSDPFPLPFSSDVNLSSPSQSDSLRDFGAPLRVPGREPGDESRTQLIRRLIYQTRKRGILETDLLLSTFAAKELWDMPMEEILEFDRLLDEPDWDIYYWLVDKKPVPPRWKETFHVEGRLGARLRKHTKNEEKEVRWMPEEPPVEK